MTNTHTVALREIAGARSGDKGNHSNKKNGHYHNDNDEKEENKE